VGEGSYQISPQQAGELYLWFSQPWWIDYDYDPVVVVEMVSSRERIAQATLSEIKGMLTYCVRGERFCEGHYDSLVERGIVEAILQRLAELRDSVPDE
jgi:hypothetical protein